MNRQSVAHVILGVAIGMVGSMLVCGYVRRSGHERRPIIAGQQVPERRFRLDFSKRYDLILGQRFEEGTRTIEDVRILGFTSPRGPGTQAGGTGDSSYDYFDHWIVGDLPDGRLTYIPAGSILATEESVRKEAAAK